MNAKSRKAEQKRNYDMVKEIKSRIADNKQVSYQERQIVAIYDKRIAKKAK